MRRETKAAVSWIHLHNQHNPHNEDEEEQGSDDNLPNVKLSYFGTRINWRTFISMFVVVLGNGVHDVDNPRAQH